MTLWHPDTCTCQIEISDTGATRGQAVQIVACKFHATADEVLVENRLKNSVCADVEIAAPGVSYEWKINDSRVVEITLLSGTQTSKNAVTTKLASYDGKAIVL